ncbi:hypothetical protein JW968_04515 [Candidatus Woesearchaeota archaeon]|nr:hypothetical protein [Candidatus Woesearchaeota archaeon]
MEERYPDLDDVVLGALNLFTQKKLPRLTPGRFRRPLVVGSGNAAVTGKILFRDQDAVFADESTYLDRLKAAKGIDGAILISASGGKHAPIIAKELRKRKIMTVLITNNRHAEAKPLVDRCLVYPKQTEPYTYNTSTYMGMMLSSSKEDPGKILRHIKKNIDPKIPKNLSKYNAFFIIVPDEFDAIREMFLTKFSELFGPMVNGRVFTPEQTKHAKTVIPSGKELFISIGYDNKNFGTNRLDLPLPKGAGHATVMAVGYYVIGKIQKQHTPYFKHYIEKYCRATSKVFGSTIKPIVD